MCPDSQRGKAFPRGSTRAYAALVTFPQLFASDFACHEGMEGRAVYAIRTGAANSIGYLSFSRMVATNPASEAGIAEPFAEVSKSQGWKGPHRLDAEEDTATGPRRGVPGVVLPSHGVGQVGSGGGFSFARRAASPATSPKCPTRRALPGEGCWQFRDENSSPCDKNRSRDRYGIRREHGVDTPSVQASAQLVCALYHRPASETAHSSGKGTVGRPQYR